MGLYISRTNVVVLFFCLFYVIIINRVVGLKKERKNKGLKGGEIYVD